MPYIIDLQSFTDERGTLTVIEKVLPFEIKRLYYITGLNELTRGGHRHYDLVEAIVCLNGSMTAFVDDGKNRQEILLDNPNQCLVIETGVWHNFYNFSEGAVLLSLASTHYDADDYITEPYTHES